MESFKRHIWRLYSLVAAVILVTLYSLTSAPPSNFPSDSIVVIARGASVPDITKQLSDSNVIKSPKFLQFALHISGTSARVQAGGYLFGEPQNLFTVAYRLVAGDYGLPPVRITFPEGVTTRDIAEKAAEVLPFISSAEFISLGKQHEGYLFPDTYFFPPDATAESVIKAMRENFDVKMEPLMADIKASGHSISDIVIMASLVEKEARTDVNRRIIAGILWDRLEIGMPLQVDAVFLYSLGRTTFELTSADLASDSPYNTYRVRGLPPTPIGSPSFDSLRAAVTPIKSDYLYYLADRNNVTHFSETYEKHVEKKRLYLGG